VPLAPYKDLANLAAVSTKLYNQVRGQEVDGKAKKHIMTCLPKRRNHFVKKVAPLDPTIMEIEKAPLEEALVPLPMELVSQFLGCRGSLDDTRSVLELLSKNRKGVVVDATSDTSAFAVSGGGGGGGGRGR
jgi:hypothetical protein